jgi:tetratricopeptide (TPR) repeat protein
MDCQRTAARFAQQATRFATLLFVWIFILLAIVKGAMAETVGQKSVDYATQARNYELQFRAGNMEVVPAYVATLEAATKAEPENANLWYMLGRAYLSQAARALIAEKPEEAMPAMQKGPAALRRALEIDPNHAEALAQIGGVQTMLGPLMQKPDWVTRGITQMNRAVELAPDSTRVRLQRAFSGLSLPDSLRNNAAEAEDLDFLILAADADASNAGDYVRIMRGDLYFELGKSDLARAMYQSVETSGTSAGVDAKARLAALNGSGVPISDIKALRSAAGAQCAMCHGK